MTVRLPAATCWWILLLGSTPLAHATTDAHWLQHEIETAPAGATIDVPAGVHAGPFVIPKTLQLRGAPGATLEGDGRTHVVEVLAPDVEISGFVIRRSGANLSHDHAGVHVRAPRAFLHHNTIVDTLHGIYLRQASEARITHNVIRGRAVENEIADPLTTSLQLSSDELCSVTLEVDQRGNGIHIWNSRGHTIADNDIRGTRDGIYFSFCDDTTVSRNTIQDVRYGLHYMYSDNNVFEENFFTQSAAGSALMYSSGIVLRQNRFVANRSHRAYGLLMHTVENTRIENNLVEGNTVGIFIENCTNNVVTGNTVASNYIGIRLSDSSDEHRFSANVLRGNIHAVETSGLVSTNDWSIDGIGNFWEDSAKLDLDRDGIADVPHFEADLFGPWRRSFPEIGLLSASPGERALRFVHARIRLPGASGVTDPRPLAR